MAKAKQGRTALMADILADVAFEATDGAGVEVSGLAFSSRDVEPGDAFFCIPGLKSDGHNYAPDAVARGAAALVVERRLELDVPQFVVDDARSTMALASARFYGMPSERLQVVGVTGTNGKTTTAYLVDWVSRALGRKTGLMGTVETRIGDTVLHADHTTPESMTLQGLLADMADAGCDEVAMEVSSHAIDLRRVLGTRFAAVAFSNLTQDHLDYHKTMENYFAAKAALFTRAYSDRAAICIDDDYGKRLAELARGEGLDVVTTGFSEGADVRAVAADYRATGTTVTLDVRGESRTVEYPLIGRFNAENIMLALGICLQLGYGLDDVCAALSSAPQAPGRLERVTAGGLDARGTHDRFGFSVFVDYAHTPDSIEKAIAALRPITEGRLVIVFGCGGDRDATKRPKMGAAACAADRIVVTSDNPRTEDPDAIIADILPGMAAGEGRYVVLPDRREAIREAIREARPGDSVLIAGKGHEDYQLVGSEVLSFDDRLVAAEELEALL